MFFSIRQKNIHTVNAFRLINSLFDATLRNIRRFALNSFKYFIHGKVNDTRRRSNVVHLGTGQLLRKRHCCQIPQTGAPYTTVASIVKNLERKQYIRAARVGNTYQYTPLIAKANTNVPLWAVLCATTLKILIRKWFRSSPKTRRFRPMTWKTL